MTGSQWNLIKELIPAAKTGGRPRTIDMRMVVNAIFYLVTSGSQWRMLPSEYPKWKSVYHMDHVRSEKPVLGTIMDILNPVVVRMMGANINRRTVENVRMAGLQIENVENLGMGDIFKLTIAYPGEEV